MDHRVIVAARLLVAAGLSTAALAPASAQSVQEAQRNLFICMQKASNLQLKDDKKQAFIDKCVAESEQPADGRKSAN
ncbi:hypothetical protein [Chenggangzhangella methanolivorans]|uniref:PsiF repeat-containing protein n=1 Tax=Chenggangzhangella methanolivorans TaxID=1437009 RepID=A0A9E6R5W4_9HYPH|nr:hypothetical protein [Chenggangzhangella methanolivorans]QZN98795.1 hypothetical protein K6K41_17805 [Chenggangzhangella methanolivorans]